MKKLKAILDSAEGLDEAIKPFYLEADGKFVLQIEGVQNHPDTLALKNAKDREAEGRRTIKAELDELKARFQGLPEDFTVEEFNRLKDEGKGSVDDRLKEQRERLTTQFNTEKATLTADRDKYKNIAEKRVVEQSLTDALVAAGVGKQFIKAAKALLKDEIKVAYEGDEILATIKSLPLSSAIKEWAESEEGKEFVVAPNNGGGGNTGVKGKPSSQNNPFKKETLNLTEQGRLKREDPDLAKQLASEAGVTL